MDVLQISFTASNTVRDDTPYTIYEIEIRSSSTITWVIYKRYSDFHKIHQEVLPLVPVVVLPCVLSADWNHYEEQKSHTHRVW